MSTKRHRAASFIDRALEIPPGTFSGGATITLNSDSEVTVDGCRGVISCSEDYIKLSLGNKSLGVSGRLLTIKSLTEREVVIIGIISSVEFC